MQREPDRKKIVSFQQAVALIKIAQANGLSTILAQGVFDIIHIGHTAFLKDAKSKADLLIVGLESDESVRLNKGNLRPFNPLNERLQLIADLECVDYVFGFEDSVSYGNNEANLHINRISALGPDFVALPIGDPYLEIRKNTVFNSGSQPKIVHGLWREYSTTKLLSYIERKPLAE